ncbi:MAG: hypothetical protein ACJ8FZ_24235, partial [Bradyrhizobium sp.]
HGQRKRKRHNSQTPHDVSPRLIPALSLRAHDDTNATRDTRNCQLFGWKCPKDDLVIQDRSGAIPPPRAGSY